MKETCSILFLLLYLQQQLSSVLFNFPCAIQELVVGIRKVMQIYYKVYSVNSRFIFVYSIYLVF